MELRILKDGTVVLVAPNCALLELAEKSLTKNGEEKGAAIDAAAENNKAQDKKR